MQIAKMVQSIDQVTQAIVGLVGALELLLLRLLIFGFFLYGVVQVIRHF
jgi:hypothetical protein